MDFSLPKTSRALDKLQSSLSYSFNDLDLLVEALTHPSASNKQQGAYAHNERLEFLGDSVLNLVVSEVLIRRYDTADEGTLSKMKARLVSKSTLAKLSNHLVLGSYLILGRGEELNEGRRKPSVLADALEAIIAAVYLDGGFSAARRLILNTYGSELDHLCSNGHVPDNKSQLQELCQRWFGTIPTYQLRHTSGPDHHRKFEVDMYLKDKRYGTGVGMTKKQAEQRAAKEALLRLQSQKSNR